MTCCEWRIPIEVQQTVLLLERLPLSPSSRRVHWQHTIIYYLWLMLVSLTNLSIAMSANRTQE